jgi:hypothetical protein
VNTLLQMLVDWLKREYLEPVIRSLKAQAASAYLEAIKGSRRLLMLLCLLVFVITLVGAGLVLIPLSLLTLSGDHNTKAIIGAAVGAIYVLVPLVAMRPLLSEKRWLSVTGAEETARRITE